MFKSWLLLCIISITQAANATENASTVLNVKNYGALGNGIQDDTDSIQAAISAASSGKEGSVVYFPSGLYITTKTLKIESSGLELRGESPVGAVSYHPLKIAGSQVQYITSDGAPVVKFGGNGLPLYHNRVEKLRIGAAANISVKPIGLCLEACSEFSLSDFQINGGCAIGLVLQDATIASIDDFYISSNDIGIQIMDHSSSWPAGHTSQQLWFRSGNVYNSTTDAIVIGGNVASISFRDTWIESCQNAFHFKQYNDDDVRCSNVTLDQVQVANGEKIDSRFIRCDAFPEGKKPLHVWLTARNCFSFNKESSHQITYTKGSNKSNDSFFDDIQIEDCTFFGSSVAIIESDTEMSSAFLKGHISATSGFNSGNTIPFGDGKVKISQLVARDGILDMSEGGSLALPNYPPKNLSTQGLFRYDPKSKHPKITDGLEEVSLPLAIYGKTTQVLTAILPSSVTTFLVDLPGAAMGDAVAIGAPSNVSVGLIWSAFISEPDRVQIRVANPTVASIDSPKGVWTIVIFK